MAHLKKKTCNNYLGSGVAQLVERSLPMPEVRSLNPVIGKLLYRTFTCLLSTVLKRQK